MKQVLACLVTALALLTVGCERQPTVVHERLLVFGTLVDITLHGATEEQGRKAISTLADELDQLHSRWHAWQKSSLVELNRALAAGGRFNADPELLQLLEVARGLSVRSDHRFNPAVGRLAAAWGFHSDLLPQAPPSKAVVSELLAARPKMTDLVIEGSQIRSSNPAVQLDFGAIAKGYAAERALKVLSEHDVDNALISLGGDIAVSGRPGSRPWRIGIRHPRDKGVLAAIDVTGGERVFTSGDYERYFEYEGNRYHHILDPRTGRPAHGLSSATVITSDGSRADAGATALFVAGKQWPEVAQALHLQQVMVVDEKGRVELTPAMAERIQFMVEPAPQVTVRRLQ